MAKQNRRRWTEWRLERRQKIGNEREKEGLKGKELDMKKEGMEER